MCLFSINPAYDIAAVHKYLDLHGAGDDLAKEHYLGMTKKADDCTRCGACEQRCPFGVKVTEKMLSARERFNARK